jgi:hypothetical protein
MPGIVLAVLCFAVGIAWMAGVFSPIMDAVNTSFGLGRG